MKFGFIAHPTSLKLKRYIKISDLVSRHIKDQEDGFDTERWQYRNLIPTIDFGQISSSNDSVCEGSIYSMPLTANEMLDQPRDIAKRVVDSVNQLKEDGAELVGLGGFTGIIGNRGKKTLEKTGVPVTTGNSLTAYTTWQNMLNVLDHLEINPENAEIAVVGYPGSIALVVAKLLLRQVDNLVLVYRGDSNKEEKLLNHLAKKYHNQVRLTNDIETCYDQVQFYVSATSSGSVIDPYALPSGSVVVDAALPQDVKSYDNDRNDIIVIDGGLISANNDFQLGSKIMGIAPDKSINGCIAETIVLALEDRAESFSVGRELSQEKVIEIGEIAAKHGLTPTRLTSYGEKIDQSDFYKLKKFFRDSQKQKSYDLEEWSGQELHSEIFQLFGEHINPYFRDFYEFNYIDRVFIEGKGCTLVDTEGKEFLDFVGGYGCLNTGHNHPDIVEAVNSYLNKGYPTFTQYVSAPAQTSILAEKLAELTPGDLERTFFSNSGTEAVEAAIKLAKAATDNPRFLYCDNSYHGKTLGSLSITGRDKHRSIFEPLLPKCTSIPFDDIEALETELEKGDVGAFILEPIQGEGGVILPSRDYLASVEKLCNKYDCILIMDEIQTGFCRTGKMFACEQTGIEPDIIALAKSLSGGLVPIGATVTRKELWDRAYGTADNFALHTSTFGGGNLAATAGIAALEVMNKEGLADNALSVGSMLKEELQNIAQNYPFIKEVRGQGLMIGIEFSNPYDKGIEGLIDEFASRIPGNVFATYQFLSDKAKSNIEMAIKEFEKSFEEMFLMRIIAKLSHQYGILTFVTANTSKVMRIQPPLVLTKKQARYFVDSFAKVCEDMTTVLG
ncbi:aminotransferase class III-fold pyridoxal phosphate-dependent enzyme [Sporohalobacter salinus]|uniref:aminotransferase class III-fold pyridoxal phosphate-dependent enzyme n=1 Tax=Sporohalobacter salinus TaxID=1494606 RepID=UPI0019607D91|nr:aminotransferase class III-fold pyridoxal phosphate-dependent enzyme [Sporohalobacter salinus]MBM7624105.1 acetylornithine/succinyldiaminopimelate/putrescine aminotransferase/predicted amino acid dehydrogenase [Sporohalobacter salinus]